MQVKLIKQSSRSRKYRIFVPVEYFERMGFVENDVVDVDIVINSNDSPAESTHEYIKFESSSDAENDEIPYGVFIPIQNVLYVGKKLYYAVNGKIVEQAGKRFEIDVKTGKIKNQTNIRHLTKSKPQTTNYARFV